MHEKKKWIRTVLLLLGFVLVCISIFLAVKQVQHNKKVAEMEAQYRELAEVTAIWPDTGEDGTVSDEAGDGAWEREYNRERMFDFEALRQKNADIIGWLFIPDTEVDYPVFQNVDNTYYLDHNMDGSTGLPGCLYSETYNKPDFTDVLSVIYGHNMKNGTMFGNLKKFQDKDYFDGHERMYLYLPDRTYTYSIIAASLYSDEHVLGESMRIEEDGIYMDFDGTEAVAFMKEIRSYRDSGAFFREGCEVEEGDTVLVLSTCDKKSTKRYLVIAKLLKE